MPEPRTPGTDIREVGESRRLRPAPTSVTVFVGAATQGPVGTPVAVAGTADYHQTFGPSLDAARPLGQAVELFFANGGRTAQVVRAAGEAPDQLVPPDGSEGAEALDDTDVSVLVVAGLSTWHTEQVTRALRRCASYSAVLLVDPPAGPWTPEATASLAALLEHRERAAVFYPWVQVGDLTVPASGAVAGVIARTDAQRGVWRAPAGAEAVLHGINGLAATVEQRTMEELSSLGVSPLRDSPGRGAVIWGSRVLGAPQASQPSERYLPTRRLVDHVHRSLTQGLGWVALEPAQPATWHRVRAAVDGFLHGLWTHGALQGTTPSEAYFVRVGLGETMTQADVAAGRLILRVGLATVRPAEFETLGLTLPARTAIDPDELVIDRSDGRSDGEEWAETYELLPGGAGVSLILESTASAGAGPRLHRHPYAETFVIRTGSALFRIGDQQVPGRAGQVLVVPALTPHSFVTGPEGYEAVHIHAAEQFETEWLE